VAVFALCTTPKYKYLGGDTMTSENIEKSLNTAFDTAFSAWTVQIEKELYPAAFADEYSWQRVKAALAINNKFLKNALCETLKNVFSENS
jgi:hypothetical protein